MKKNVTVDDVVRGAPPLLENKKTWTRRTFARAANGSSVMPTNPDAVCWCAVGALYKAEFDLSDSRNVAFEAIAKLETFADWPLVCVNDIEGRQAVVALFKKALAA
jgi:hypothetical protein